MSVTNRNHDLKENSVTEFAIRSGMQLFAYLIAVRTTAFNFSLVSEWLPHIFSDNVVLNVSVSLVADSSTSDSFKHFSR